MTTECEACGKELNNDSIQWNGGCAYCPRCFGIEAVYELIMNFILLYPDAEWGLAQIVLGDYNLSDYHIDRCLEQVAEYELTLEQQSVVKFLEFLKTIPEELRDES